MEKLVLRGIMYGADKIPDSWFEKVPGGYYAAKDKNGKPVKSAKSKTQSKDSHPPRSRRARRHSNDYADRRRYSHDYSRSGRRKSSYDRYYNDGYASDDDEYRQARKHGERRRDTWSGNKHRSHSEDRDRQRRDEPSGFPGFREPDYNGRRNGRSRPPPIATGGPPPAISPEANIRGQTGYVPPMSPPAAPATSATEMPHKLPPLSRGPAPPAYVPYAHLYGAQLPQTPPSSDDDSRPKGFTPTSSPDRPQPYSQDPYAQQAPTAAAAGAGAAYDGKPGYVNSDRYHPRYNAGNSGYTSAKNDSQPADPRYSRNDYNAGGDTFQGREGYVIQNSHDLERPPVGDVEATRPLEAPVRCHDHSNRHERQRQLPMSAHAMDARQRLPPPSAASGSRRNDYFADNYDPYKPELRGRSEARDGERRSAYDANRRSGGGYHSEEKSRE